MAQFWFCWHSIASMVWTNGALMVLIATLSPCLAQSTVDFRIETDVTVADKPEPIHQSVTIFQAGVAFDFSRNEPHRITVIDPSENRIVFLDSRRELQARINLQDLQAFMEKARKELASSSMAAALEDAQKVQIDPAAGKVVVGQRFFRYEANYQQPENAELSRVYAEFANASACINAWQAPDRSPPSFARVQLNQTLRDNQAIPSDITRTTFTSGGQEHVLKSRLHASWQLSDEDRKTAESFRAMLLVFPNVEVGDFLTSDKVSSGKKSTIR